MEEDGIELTESMRATIRQGIQAAGSRDEFARLAGVAKSGLQWWVGAGERRDSHITWATWARVRNVLAQLRLLDPADPRWILPSELRAEVLRLRAAAGRHTTIAAGDGAAVANGSHASASSAAPSEERAAARLDRLAAWILPSGLPPEDKLAALAIAHG